MKNEVKLSSLHPNVIQPVLRSKPVDKRCFVEPTLQLSWLSLQNPIFHFYLLLSNDLSSWVSMYHAWKLGRFGSFVMQRDMAGHMRHVKPSRPDCILSLIFATLYMNLQCDSDRISVKLGDLLTYK